MDVDKGSFKESDNPFRSISSDIFRIMVESAPVLIALYRDRFIYANPYALNLLGYKKQEITKYYVWDIIPEEKKEEVKEIIERSMKGEDIIKEYSNFTVYTKKGEKRILKLITRTVKIGKDYARLAVGVDITKEKNLEKNLISQKKKFEAILSTLHDITCIVDRRGIIRYVSSVVEKYLKWKPEEIIGKHAFRFVHEDDRTPLIKLYNMVLNNPGKMYTAEFRLKTKDNIYRWFEANISLPENWKEIGVEGPIISLRDITDKKLAQLTAITVAYHDPLTGLPNRFLLLEKLRDVLEGALQRSELVAVVVLNVINFKEINSVYGIKAGDEVLKEIGTRLVRSVRSDDVVARFFADEFGVILTRIHNLNGLEKAISKIKRVFEKPFEIRGQEIYLSANMGVAVFPKDGVEAEELLRKAELALSRAKDMGEGLVMYYSEDIERELAEIALLRGALKDAVKKGQIKVLYQPVFRLSDLKIVGVEALARWYHPEFGVISPVRFISIAEETGYIYEIGDYIVELAVSQMSYLQKKGYDLSIAINFSAKQFEDPKLTQKIMKVLTEYKFPAKNFIVEITESTAMKNPEKTKRILSELKLYGMKIAIDDFGTGYSSMNYLIEFDVDKIKIDKSFTLRMLESKKAETVVRAIVYMSSSMRAKSLAEGIENERILNSLRKLGCDEGQGFFLGKPMKFEELMNFLKDKSLQ